MSFLKTGTQSYSDKGIDYHITLNSGFSSGMVIRKSFTKLLSFETGINYVRRKYNLSIVDGGYTESADFNIIGYEIPVSLLIYAQTGEKTFMNASMGISPDMFASNVETIGPNHRSYTARFHVVQPAIIVNLGWEYRTIKSGYFYLGASFHSPFGPLFRSNIYYTKNGEEYAGFIDLSGSYLTVDIRYFFAPDSKKRKERSESDD